MPLTGNFSELRRAIAALNKLADPRFFHGIAELVGAEMVQLVDTEFQTSTDPSGKSWLPLKHRNGQPLLDRGRLAASFSAQVSGDTVSVGTNTSYAKYHQHGTNGRREASSRNQPINKRGKFQSKDKAAKRKAGAVAFRELNFTQGGGAIPRRQFLPDEDRPLPAKWDTSIARVITEQIERVLAQVA